MNKNRYRIIFSHARGMFIAVAEIVKSKTKQAGQSQGQIGTDSTIDSVLPIHYKKLNPLNFAVIGCLGALVISLPMSSVAETQIIADKGTSWNDGGCWLLNLDFEPIKLSTNVKNKILGESIQIALNAGKNIPPENVKNILFSPELDSLMTERVKKLMAEFGYKSKKALFKHMRKVSITYINDTYKISPSHQDGLDYSFTGLSKADEIILPNDATDEELGQAVRLAYEKCTSIY